VPGSPANDVSPRATEALIADTLPQIDLPARVDLLTGSAFWRTRSLDAVGLRSLVFSDGGAGVRGKDGAPAIRRCVSRRWLP
jgi:beta-glucosidase